MKRSLVSMSVYVTVILCLASLAWSIDKEEETKRINNAATVLSEIMTTPDKGIPDSVMKNAKCVAVVPSLVKAGFVFGGQ